MIRLLKYFLYFLFLPLWWLQLLIPRNKNIWVFGAWYGKKYSDNSKYLFEYITMVNSPVKSVWITKNKAVNNYLRDLGYSSYMAYSIMGVYYCLHAKYVFVSSTKKDINELFINGAKKIQLWHGNPMKKIGLDDKYSASNDFLYQVFVKRIFSMAYEFDYDHVISSGPCFTEILSSAFNIPKSKVLETGCPRNDVFYIHKTDQFNDTLRTKFKDCKLVYYLPTFRNLKTPISLFTLKDYEKERLEDFLEKENMVFVSKGHFIDNKLNDEVQGQSTRIFHLSDENVSDLNFLLKDADILITDYSSAYFDFLLTQRPIIFAAFDLEEYLSSSREMYFEYENVISGPIVETWEALFNELKNSDEHLSKYGFKLADKNDLFNKYHDGNNSLRVYECIKNLAK